MNQDDEDSGPQDGAAFTVGYAAADEEQPSQAIVRAIGRVSGTHPADLTPLSTVIDVDALDALFGRIHQQDDFYRGSAEPPGPEPRFSFNYEGCRVVVKMDRVEVVTLSDPDPPG